MAEPFPLAPALWAATAPPGPDTPPLNEDREAEVCVVGGGFAGLSAALHLAEGGVRVVVLEAQEPGWGASGRNGGHVIPGLKYDPDVLRAKFSGDAGERLVDFAGRTADMVFDLIARHRMDVPHRRAGWVQGAHTAAGLDEVARRAEQWARTGADVAVLDRAAVADHLGSDAYLGGWVDRRGGAAARSSRWPTHVAWPARRWMLAPLCMEARRSRPCTGRTAAGACGHRQDTPCPRARLSFAPTDIPAA